MATVSKNRQAVVVSDAPTLHPQNAPKMLGADEINDDAEYDVTLARTVAFGGNPGFFKPDNHHVIKGGFLKTLMSDAANEGAFSVATRVPSSAGDGSFETVTRELDSTKGVTDSAAAEATS